MNTETTVHRLRKELFYGLSKYTKNMPDFFVPERLEILSPRQGYRFLDTVAERIHDEQEVIVYVHFPFCVSECTYCNTFPHPADRKRQEEYVRNLLREIELVHSRGVLDGKRIRCLYFGGGTPTSFGDEELEAITRAVVESSRGVRFTESGSYDFTVESKPSPTLSETRINRLQEMGATRISLGCQTFDSRVLNYCGRTHTPEEAAHCIDRAHDARLKVNLDMMLGLPGQSVENVMDDLQILEYLDPDAIEYIRHEVVNPKVIGLYRRQPELMTTDDALFEMIRQTHAWIERYGYEQNGRFTGPEAFPYRYHWLKEKPIIAFGSRARSYAGGLCWENHDNLHLYYNMCDAGFAAVGRTLESTPRELMFRSIYLGLQLAAGVNRRSFRKIHGTDPAEAFPGIFDRLSELECISVTDDHIALTPMGRTFIEDVSCHLIDSILHSEYGELRRVPHSSGTHFREQVDEYVDTRIQA